MTLQMQQAAISHPYVTWLHHTCDMTCMNTLCVQVLQKGRNVSFIRHSCVSFIRHSCDLWNSCLFRHETDMKLMSLWNSCLFETHVSFCNSCLFLKLMSLFETHVSFYERGSKCLFHTSLLWLMKLMPLSYERDIYTLFHTKETWVYMSFVTHSYMRRDSFTCMQVLEQRKYLIRLSPMPICDMSRLFKILGLFDKKALGKRWYSAKETC